jgi:hypothetical protein
MNFTESREKKFTYATFALYILGWILGSDYIIWALLSFCGSAVCALGTVAPGVKFKKEQRTQVYFAITAFILPLGVLLIGYQGTADANRFKNYLSEHHCKNIGLTITGYSKGDCDRVGNCVEPHEIEEPEYFCSTTKKRITYSDFKAGHYGQ